MVASVVDGQDVGVIQHAGGAPFELKATQPVGIGGERGGGQHLHGYIARQARVAGAVHFSHPAGAQRGEDLIGPKEGALGKRHKE